MIRTMNLLHTGFELYNEREQPGQIIQYSDWCKGCIIGGSNPGRGNRYFSPPKCPDQMWGSPSILQNRYRGSFPVVKVAGREAGYSPPSSAEDKNDRSCNSTPSLRRVDRKLPRRQKDAELGFSMRHFGRYAGVKPAKSETPRSAWRCQID